MGLIRGGIITTSAAGGAGSAIPSGTSGVLSINSEYGPHITLSSDASIQITKPTTNNIQFSCSGFVSGVQQYIEAELAASGQILLSANNASGQYIWTQLNASGQYLWNELNVSGQLLRNEIAESGQVILSNVVRSIGVQGGADLKGDVDFTDPSGFIVWGDSAGSSPITASIDTHALSGLWGLNQININKSNLAASGQVILNELAVSGQVLLTEINTKADQADLDASGQVLLSNDAASGQYLWSELKVSGQLLLSNTAASGQLLVTKEDCDWNGFPNRNDCTISFDHSTRIFSIQPTGSEFDYYIGCTQYISTGDTIAISADEGVHYICYDGPTLTETLNPSDSDISTTIRTKALVSVVYWGANQASGIYVGEERHGMSMSPVTHTYLHFTNGLEYLTGLGLNNITANGDGDLDISAVFGVDSGSVADEDIFADIAAVPSGEGLPLYYMTGATPSWNKVDPSGFSVRTFDQTANTRLAYNEFTGGVWQLAEVSNNDFVLYHVFATTEKDKPMITVMGQDVYTNIAQARAGAKTEILSLVTNDIILPEIRPIATVIFQTSNLYNNQVKGRIRTTDDGEDYIDWRSEEISRVTLTTSNHNNLTGLQGGASNEYYHLTQDEHDTLTDGSVPHKYYGYFSSFGSGYFNHNLNTKLLTWNVYASGTTVDAIDPDNFRIIDNNSVFLQLNSPETGLIVIMG